MKRLISFLSLVLVLSMSTGLWGWEFNEDDNTEGWIPSPSITDVGVADGSARFINEGMDASVWADACDPRDGSPLRERF